MDKTSFTQEPWEASERGDYSDFDAKSRVIMADDMRIAVVHHSGDDESEGNSNLIAGAPELYRSLQELLDDINDIVRESEGVAGFHLNGDVEPWEGYSSLSGSIHRAQTALKGARGEANA
ncbi:MAG: hypothetical protein COB93_02395 [Sneathiella sp.]|nr:MAG: hypothetical protein COB93_02395 [Sneathiella sp.]